MSWTLCLTRRRGRRGEVQEVEVEVEETVEEEEEEEGDVIAETMKYVY